MRKNVIIGTAGHIDHGKSALVRALTGTDPDRLKEEKERGITIELGFAHLALPSGATAGIIDVPGHEKFVRTMVAGAAGIDIVMLVVAADEGIMPQTREHLDICRLLAVRHGLVVLNKCDKTESDWIDLLEEDVRKFTLGTFLQDSPIVRVSALTGEGLPDLVLALDALARVIPGKDPSNFFRLPVDRSFTMKGFGTVVTGTLVGGTVRVGDEVQVLPGGTVARVRGLQVHGGAVDVASAGSRTAVNLQGLEKEQAPRGAVLCRPGTVRPTRAVEALIDYLPLAPRPLARRALVSFHAGTASCLGRIIPYGAPEIPPGGAGFARIGFDQEMVLLGGDRFIIRGFSPLENFGFTIGGGVVAHPHPPARRGAAKSVPPALPALLLPDPELRVLAAFEDAGISGLGDLEAAAVAGIGPVAAREIVEALVASGRIRKAAGDTHFWHPVTVSAVARQCVDALSGLHARNPDREGFLREEIAAALPAQAGMALVALSLEGNADVAQSGEHYYLPAKRPRKVELDSPLAKAVAEAVRRARLAAPSKAELADALKPRDAKEFEKTLDGLARAGAIVRVKEFCFDAAEVGALKGRLVAFLEARGEIAVPDFKEMTGLTRKHIIPLLEYFDLTRVTLRVGDKRVLRKGK